MTAERQTIALIGGGRWARVHASNLTALLTSRDRVLWVSRHHQDALRNLVAQLPRTAPVVELLSDVEDATKERPSAALIVTAPATHFTLAAACLRRGIHTFAEKPLAFEVGEARSLIDSAAKADLVLSVGFHLLSASYLRHFKSHIAGRDIARISIRWFDPIHEVRYGETKRAGESTPLVHDVYPHIWSLVRVLTGCGEQVVGTASKQADGAISFEMTADLVKVDVQCSRYALARERKIDIGFRSDETASLDFTEEPGLAMLNNVALPPDPLWGKSPRPVMAEIREFLTQISLPMRDPEWPQLASNCLDSVIGAQALFSRLETCRVNDPISPALR